MYPDSEFRHCPPYRVFVCQNKILLKNRHKGDLSQQWQAMVKRSLPSLPELGVWTSMAMANVFGGFQAEARENASGLAATNNLVALEGRTCVSSCHHQTDPARLLQSAGGHIIPRMNQV